MQIDVSAMEIQSEKASQLLVAMGNQKRLLILCHLMDQERSVGEIADLVELRQSPLSQHLAKLRALGLVTTRREGQSIYYRLASSDVEAVLRTLYAIFCEPEPARKHA